MWPDAVNLAVSAVPIRPEAPLTPTASEAAAEDAHWLVLDVAPLELVQPSASHPYQVPPQRILRRCEEHGLRWKWERAVR